MKSFASNLVKLPLWWDLFRMQWSDDVQKYIKMILQAPGPKKTAVFDIDGTLWRDDIGEGFFKYQIKHQSALGLLTVSEPLKYYFDLEKKDPIKAYGWLAQINAGLAEDEVRRQAKICYEEKFKKIISNPVKELIAALKKNQFDVWLCTASIRWAAEPLLADLQIPADRLIAAEVKVNAKKMLTTEVVTPLPYESGKKYWIESKIGTKPTLVVGNSRGDIPMLEMAQYPLGVVFMPHRSEVEASEKTLLLEAKKRNWPTQIFQ